MEKNQLKMYDAPVVEVVEMKVSAPLLEGSGGSDWDPSDPVPRY